MILILLLVKKKPASQSNFQSTSLKIEQMVLNCIFITIYSYRKYCLFFIGYIPRPFFKSNRLGPLDYINFLTILPTLLFNFSGVLIAAYLVYYLRVRSNDALRYVRLKRPGAVQTRRQIECVKEFEAYFLPQVSNLFWFFP